MIELTAEIFAQAMREQRERRGFTQAEAAAHCRVSPSVWSRWESWEAGKSDPLYPTMLGVLQMMKYAKPKR